MEEPNYQPGSSPIYTMLGARPRFLPDGRGSRASWRGPLVLLGVMFGWMIILLALAGSAAPTSSGAPINVGSGVVVTPAGGWYSTTNSLLSGLPTISLQKSGAEAAFAAESFTGTNDALLQEWTAVLNRDMSSYRPLPSSSTTIAGNIPAIKVLFTGVSSSSRTEGELVVAASAGTGVIMLALASPGQLAGLQRDLDTMLQSLQVP